jgi:NAD(P)-dependent dehydrogenase (short-subunit alcohol dehydrogenase family)
VWLRLPKVPVLRPWQAPATWGELRAIAACQGIDLDEGLRRTARRIRDGREHVALIGFPIPRTVGEPASQMHWQALRLPALSRDQQLPNGRRSGEAGLWQNDRRTVFAPDQRIDWLPSENWNPAEVATRGRFPDAVATQHVVVIGAGALGSAIAELLVRAGVSRLTLVDDDVLQAGNLVRHTLGLPDLLRSKASAIADRLNLSNPNARVDALVESFPPSDSDQPQLQAADVVIDTTGANAVVASLAEFPWGRPRLFASVSLGLGARRMYLYTARAAAFPNTDFRRLVDPLVAEDHEQFEGELPWGGIGCWHPVFPARGDDVWLLAAAAVKRIVGAIERGPEEAKLVTIEQEEDGEFMGVRIC